MPDDRLLVRSLLRAAAVMAALFAALAVGLAALRIPYPFELEWMEGAMVDHVHRVREGLPIYAPPTADHIPFLYTPLFYWAGALVSQVTGEGFAALRGLAFACALGCAALLFAIARDLGKSRLLGWIAAGLFLAGHGYLRSWYDLARNDTLFLFPMLAAAMLLGRKGRRNAVLAGLCCALAFLGKQTALIWIPPLAIGALLLDVGSGIWFAGTTAVLGGLAVLGLDLRTDGWFWFYVFEMPRGHEIEPEKKLGFLTQDLVPMLPALAASTWFAIARWRSAERRPALFLAAFAGGGLVASWLSRLHAGGYDNVLMYGFASCCALLAALPSRAPLAGACLVLLQFAFLVLDPRCLIEGRPALLYDPAAMVPSRAHREASEELLAYLRASPKDVLVPFHGALAGMAGKPASLHAQALFDLWQRFRSDLARREGTEHGKKAFDSLRESLARDLRAGRWSAIVLDRPHGPALERILDAVAKRAYSLAGDLPLRDPKALRPLTGMETHSPFVLVPAK